MLSWLSLLTFFLRGTAAILLLALPAVFFPFDWMDGLHRSLGLGSLSSQPMVAYLARSASALYACLGALYLYLSRDPLRWLDLLVVLAWIKIAFGLVVLGVDLAEGMPWYWTAAEGPFILAHSAAVFFLVAKNRPEEH